MIQMLFLLEIIVGGVVILTTYMISYKFKNIEESLAVYMSSRVYKTQSYVAFIERVITRYKECVASIGVETNIESMIKAELCKEYIGKFPLVLIQNTALRGSRLMWGIILFEGVIASAGSKGQEASAIAMITASLFVTILIEMFKFVKGIEEQKDVIVMLTEDYVLNIYPVELKKNLTSKELIKLKARIAELEKELKIEDAIETAINEYKQKEKKSNSVLSTQDIAKLIGILQ